jgi:predicted nucleic acid-binding protein
MLEIWKAAEAIVCVSTGYVEGRAAIARRVRRRFVSRARGLLDDCWEQMQTVTLDDSLIALAARVADTYRLKALDAMHLAAAVQTGRDLTFVSWDDELAASARDAGFATAPAD